MISGGAIFANVSNTQYAPVFVCSLTPEEARDVQLRSAKLYSRLGKPHAFVHFQNGRKAKEVTLGMTSGRLEQATGRKAGVECLHLKMCGSVKNREDALVVFNFFQTVYSSKYAGSRLVDDMTQYIDRKSALSSGALAEDEIIISFERKFGECLELTTQLLTFFKVEFKPNIDEPIQADSESDKRGTDIRRCVNLLQKAPGKITTAVLSSQLSAASKQKPIGVELSGNGSLFKLVQQGSILTLQPFDES